MTGGAVKDSHDDYRRSMAGGGGGSGPGVPGDAGRSSRYYLRPQYQIQPPRHHDPAPRHDYPVPRDYLPPEKLDDIYSRHKEEFFGQHRIKERDDLPPPAGYGGPPSPDDPFARPRPQRTPADRYPRMPQEYGPGVPPEYPPMYTPPTTVAGPGQERVSRLLELYGTLDGRNAAPARSHSDLYGSLDGRGSRLSDIFPTSEAARLRQNAEFRNSDETRSLSGRDCSNLAEMYRRRELPPAPPEYRLHDYRSPPRHDFRNQQKPPMDQDVIENPMYEVDRRAAPRTPGPRTPTPNPPTPQHPQHMAPHLHHHLGRTSPRPVQEVRYTQAIANQEDAIRASYVLFGEPRRIVPVGGRPDNQRANSTPNAALGSSIAAAAAVASRQQQQQQQQHMLQQQQQQALQPPPSQHGHPMGAPPPPHAYQQAGNHPGPHPGLSAHTSGPPATSSSMVLSSQPHLQPPTSQHQPAPALPPVQQPQQQPHHQQPPPPPQQQQQQQSSIQHSGPPPNTGTLGHHSHSSNSSSTPAHSYAAAATSRPAHPPSSAAGPMTLASRMASNNTASSNATAGLSNAGPPAASNGATSIASQSSKPRYGNSAQPLSRKEQVKEFVKKETREFFGLDEGTEESQRQRWEDKRRRLASRKYGQLKENTSSLSASLSASAAAGFGVGVGGRCAASSATVAVGGANNGVSGGYHQHHHHHHHGHYGNSFSNDFHSLRDLHESVWRESGDYGVWPRPPPHRGKDSVAKMTWDGLSFIVATVSKRRAKSQASGTPGGQSKSRSYAPTSVHSLDSLASDRLLAHSDSSPASSSSGSS